MKHLAFLILIILAGPVAQSSGPISEIEGNKKLIEFHNDLGLAIKYIKATRLQIYGAGYPGGEVSSGTQLHKQKTRVVEIIYSVGNNYSFLSNNSDLQFGGDVTIARKEAVVGLVQLARFFSVCQAGGNQKLSSGDCTKILRDISVEIQNFDRVYVMIMELMERYHQTIPLAHRDIFGK